MTLDEQVLQLYPLISYEEDRAKDGPFTLIEETERRALYEGVSYCKRHYRRANGEDVWTYITTIAPDAPVQLATSACPLRTVKMVKKHAAEFDGHVIYAMNASFFHYFNGGDLTPYGIQIMHGVEMALPGKDKPEYSNNWVGVTKEGKTVIGNADDYYQIWRGKLAYAVGGGMRLIRNGEIRLPCDPDHDPRTTVGIAADGTVILMCADGRSKRSAGMTYGDVIDLYTSLGYDVRELLNLDGGGSTTVVLREEKGFAIQNVPSGPPLPISYSKYDLTRPEPSGDSQARAVADCVLIVAKDR